MSFADNDLSVIPEGQGKLKGLKYLPNECGIWLEEGLKLDCMT
jgi:hypothetical protein